MSDLANALMVAIRVHAGQRDKQGQPYLLHVLRVVGAVSDEAKVVAALHDVLEDSPEHNRLGVRALPVKLELWEGLAIERLTRGSTEPYDEYIGLLAQPDAAILEGRVDQHRAVRVAREVKLADLRDNLGRIPPRREPRVHGIARSWDDEWASLKARYEKAIETLERAA